MSCPTTSWKTLQPPFASGWSCRCARVPDAIVLRADPISGTDGDTVTYTYLVTNTGDALVRKISVRDDRLGAIGTVPQLAPGHSATLQAQRVLSTTDVWVTNTATARGIDGAGDAVLASDETSVTIVGAGLHAGGSGNGGDGTAFTGLDATGASAAAMLLALAGVCLLAAARRRA